MRLKRIELHDGSSIEASDSSLGDLHLEWEPEQREVRFRWGIRNPEWVAIPERAITSMEFTQ